MASGMQFTDRAQRAIIDANELATQYAHPQMLPFHLAISLLDPPAHSSKHQQPPAGHASHSPTSMPLFRQVVERAHGDPQTLDRALKKSLVRRPSKDPPPDHTPISPGL